VAIGVNERANTFEQGRRYTSLGTEVPFPLTSQAFASNLTSLPSPQKVF